MLIGPNTECKAENSIDLLINDVEVRVGCLVAPIFVCCAEVILEVDIIKQLDGVIMVKDGKVFWGARLCASARNSNNEQFKIEDNEFLAVFNNGVWIVEWKWQNKEPMLSNRCEEYTVPPYCLEEYETEVYKWISEGWLELHNEMKDSSVTGVMLLVAACQPNKPKKVRPVMD